MQRSYPEIWDLYDAGKFAEATNAINAAIGASDDPELHVLRAWIYYRAEQFEKAWDETELAKDHPDAIPVKMQILAYSDGHQNDALLMSLALQCPDDIRAANALLIRARKPNSGVTRAAVREMCGRFLDTGSIALRDVGVANFLHNAGRFFLESTQKEDLVFAAGLFRSAKAHYGTVGHWHHRAALAFWTSTVMERMGDIPGALTEANDSVTLWMAQIEVDRSIEKHQEKFNNAQKRVIELLGKLSSFLESKLKTRAA